MNFTNSRKISKKLLAISMCALMAVSSLGITAAAKNTDYEFSVAAGTLKNGYWATKDDDDQIAYINAKKIIGNFIMYAVTKSGTKSTESKIVKKTGKKEYEYLNYAGKGVTRGICAYNNGNSKATVSGIWCP